MSIEERIALYLRLEDYDKKLAHYRKTARKYFRENGMLKHLPNGSYYRDDSDPDYEILSRPCQKSSSSHPTQRPPSDVEDMEAVKSPSRKKSRFAGGIVRIILRSNRCSFSFL